MEMFEKDRFSRRILLSIIYLCLIVGCAKNQATLTNTNTVAPRQNIRTFPAIQDARETYVYEPIFRGDIYLYEAGLTNQVSIVLVHGVGDMGAKCWEYIIPELAKQYHVVTFDLPGFGRSNKQNVLYSPDQYASFIKWVVDKYVNGPMILVGHSLGGALTLRYAATYPNDLQCLILIDVAGILHRAALTEFMLRLNFRNLFNSRLSRLFTASFETLNHLSGTLINDLENEKVSGLLDKILGNNLSRKWLLGEDATKIAGLALVQEDHSRVIEQMHTPCHILWGADDAIAPLRTGKLLAAKLSHAKLQIIPDVGHTPMLEQPQLFNNIFLDVLNSESIYNSPPLTNKTPGERIERCINRSNVIFSGRYKSIDIVDSSDIQLVNVSAEHVTIRNSKVVIENSYIQGTNSVLEIDNSKVTITAGRIEGKVAILTSNSQLDLAGVHLVGRQAAIRAKDKSICLFSVSKLESPFNNGYLHGIRRVSNGKAF